MTALDRRRGAKPPHRVIADVASETWRARAHCTGMDVDMFFPVDGEKSVHWRERSKYARTLCGRCPVSSDCLASALARKEKGVWGGTVDAERYGRKDRPADARPNSPPGGGSAA